MMAERRIVYDNDFPAKDLLGAGWQRWHSAAGSGWTADKAHGFAHQGATPEGIDWLRYRHILRPSDSREAPSGNAQPGTDHRFHGLQQHRRSIHGRR